ncbi:hypothetical protein F2P79_016668 [Pimephales promelas]|nr:hypothetical protein F2P79_016668 [Pimephales promelas]
MYRDRRTRVCLSGGERLMMLKAVIKGSEAFVVDQDQGKMMAAFVGGKKVSGILLKYKDLKCLQTGVSTEDEEPRAESWKWCHG